MVDEREERRITIRVSPNLHNKVAQAAGERNLSINAFIIQALEHSIDSDFAARLAAVEAKLRLLTDGP